MADRIFPTIQQEEELITLALSWDNFFKFKWHYIPILFKYFFVETDIISTIPDPVLEFVANYRVPLKRLGKPEEVANAIKFMLSDDASYMNGHSLVLDGGMDAG